MTAAGHPVPDSRALILIVEDHADTRLMYAEFLGLDYDVLDVSGPLRGALFIGGTGVCAADSGVRPSLEANTRAAAAEVTAMSSP